MTSLFDPSAEQLTQRRRVAFQTEPEVITLVVATEDEMLWNVREDYQRIRRENDDMFRKYSTSLQQGSDMDNDEIDIRGLESLDPEEQQRAQKYLQKGINYVLSTQHVQRKLHGPCANNSNLLARVYKCATKQAVENALALAERDEDFVNREIRGVQVKQEQRVLNNNAGKGSQQEIQDKLLSPRGVCGSLFDLSERTGSTVILGEDDSLAEASEEEDDDDDHDSTTSSPEWTTTRRGSSMTLRVSNLLAT